MLHRTTAGTRARPGFHRGLLALPFCLQKERREKGKEKKSLFRVIMNFQKRWEQVQFSSATSTVTSRPPLVSIVFVFIFLLARLG